MFKSNAHMVLQSTQYLLYHMSYAVSNGIISSQRTMATNARLVISLTIIAMTSFGDAVMGEWPRQTGDWIACNQENNMAVPSPSGHPCEECVCINQRVHCFMVKCGRLRCHPANQAFLPSEGMCCKVCLGEIKPLPG